MATILNRQVTFSTNGTVTAAGLHNLIDQTEIYAGIITTQPVISSVGSSDELLIADADLTPTSAPRKVTVGSMFNDALNNGIYTTASFTGTLSAGTFIGPLNGNVSGTIVGTGGTISNLTTGTTTSTAQNVTSGTIGTLNSTTGTIQTLNSTTGTISNFNATSSTFNGAITGSTNTINIGSGQIYKDSSGNVGIGTNAPEGKIHAQNPSGSITSLIVTGDGALGSISTERYQDSTQGPNIIIRKGRGSKSSPTAVATNDNCGLINFSVFGGTNNRTVAQVYSSVENYTSDTNISSNLVFTTTSSGTTPNSAVYINSSGNLSLGTATALSKLHVHGDVTLSNTTTATSAATGGVSVPATAAGFLTVSINGTSRKIPYYA